MGVSSRSRTLSVVQRRHSKPLSGSCKPPRCFVGICEDIKGFDKGFDLISLLSTSLFLCCIMSYCLTQTGKVFFFTQLELKINSSLGMLLQIINNI